jgi:hypothetical protein
VLFQRGLAAVSDRDGAGAFCVTVPPPFPFQIAGQEVLRRAPQPDRKAARKGVVNMEKVVIPTVVGFLSLMGVWVVFDTLHVVVM